MPSGYSLASMALSTGTRFWPYEVSDQLGVGGMGDVCRATDTNLKRQVAIKVLPAAVAGDAERIADVASRKRAPYFRPRQPFPLSPPPFPRSCILTSSPCSTSTR